MNNRKLPADHETTITSTRVRKIEDKLALDLAKVVQKIRLEPVQDISLLRRRYDIQVTDLIRNAVQRVYNQAVLYVTKFLGVSDFITSTDLSKIKDYTIHYVDQFWFRINKYVLGRNTVLEQKLHYHPRSPLSDDYIVTILSTALTTRVLSLATINKTKQLINHVPVRTAQSSFFNIVMVWKTAKDERVCPFCRQYDEKTFDLLDFRMPIPPDQSHPRCRCRVMLKDIEPTTLAFILPTVAQPFVFPE